MLRVVVMGALGALGAACAASPNYVPGVEYRGASPGHHAPPVQAVQHYAPPPDARPSDARVLYVCNYSASNSGALGPNGEALAFTPAIEAGAVVLWRNPTEGACLSSGFGWRGSATGGGRQHRGMDLANPNGGYIFAAADGQVVAAGSRGDYGLTVEIDHGSGVRTLYAHLSEILPGVVRGASAAAGFAIGRMGATGNATGVHLHYEVTVHGQQVDPLSWGAPVAEPLPNS
jgi:murein DD-endopeptidase MepM/ murein hydrolase activator NlpD